jgi:hypothetical protein
VYEQSFNPKPAGAGVFGTTIRVDAHAFRLAVKLIFRYLGLLATGAQSMIWINCGDN